ncbi:MAG TPA: DUF58 domain-containing protein [Polyangiaceae bacterium]|jgi:uncharacterized protein (DUF58 family)
MSSLQRDFDWARIGALRLRARHIAEGVYAGSHRSVRRGAGIEFGGHRPYLPGDDLRWLDRHALMRHGRLLIREFETETDRTVCVLMDASASMGFQSTGAPAPKLAFAALLAAALFRIALVGGDAVVLDWLGGRNVKGIGPVAGRDAFERVATALEEAEAGERALLDDAAVDRACARLWRAARRGSIILLFSDLLDLPASALERVTGLAGDRRLVVVVRVLDPIEKEFPFEGPIQLRALEGNALIETDASSARAEYLENLEAIAQRWRDRLLVRGGQLVDVTTRDDAFAAVLRIMATVRGDVR